MGQDMALSAGSNWNELHKVSLDHHFTSIIINKPHKFLCATKDLCSTRNLPYVTVQAKTSLPNLLLYIFIEATYRIVLNFRGRKLS